MRILNYITDVLQTSILQVLMLFAPVFLLGFLVHVISIHIEKAGIKLMGLKTYLYSLGWLGIMIHEGGHAVFCLLFRHKITDIKLFSPDYKEGTMGYVNHSYNKNNVFQQIGNLFIGIGPVLAGVFLLFGIFYVLFDYNILKISELSEISFQLPFKEIVLLFLNNIFTGIKDVFSLMFSSSHPLWKYIIMIYILLSVGSSVSLSIPDLKTAFSGFLYFVLLLILFNLGTFWITDFTTDLSLSVISFLSGFYFLMILSAILNSGFLILFLLLNFVFRRS